MPTQRQHMKELLEAEEKQNPGLFKSILSAIRPLMGIDTADSSSYNPPFPKKAQNGD
jgi:Spy/CpxP family protein refolding chaperone